MTKNPQVVEDDVLDKWLKPMCPRLMGRRCTTLYCLKRGGYTGEPADASIATCEPYEAYNALSNRNAAATRMRERCVARVKEYGKSHQLCHPLRARAAVELVEILESLTHEAANSVKDSEGEVDG